MTDIRCPMCSKPNPAGSSTCQYCGARITPLGAPSEATPADDMPDWLKDLRGPDNLPGGEETSPASPTPESDVPDWLSRIRERNQPEPPQGESAETPDWLADLTGGSQPASAAAEPTPGGGEADWLSSLRAPTPESPAEPTPVEPSPEAAVPANDMPDWLQNLAGEQAPQPPQEPSTPTEAPAGPVPANASGEDWLNNLGSWQPSQAAEPTVQMPRQPAEESSDWLSGLQESPPAEGGGAAAEDEDWLKNLQSWSPGTETPAAQEPAPASETPDWLSGLPPMAEETPAAQEPTPAGETPDWLSGLPTESAEAAPAEEIPVLSGEIPDWLKGSMPVEPIAEEASTEAVDWMKGMPVENEPAAQATPAGEEEGTPDWLKAYAEPPGSVPLESQPAAAFPAEDMAEWLAPEGAETSGSATSPFVGSAGLGTDWEGNQPGEGVPAATPAFSFDVPPNEQTPESELPFSDQELPDWLASGEETQAGAPAAAFEGIPEDLAPADLPTWVAAMRPVESAAPLPTPTTQDDQRVENLGPLAGVKGVLPSQDVVVQYAKPPIYSVKLQVTDRQRLHSNLLEAMLNEENQPRTVAHELTSKSARWFRLGVALILLAALLIPLIFGGANPIPAAISAPGTPAERLYNEINSVSGSPVLLIVDYEPGLSAELHIAAEGVVQHLMEKSDSLAVISSSPTGPILAEKLLSESYPLNNLSVNLGYVPGGTTALQALVSDLRGTLREPLRGSWDHPALQGIQKLSDFKQVILLTGNDQSARDWIEQIQPALGDTPLLVISSAQAAPMLQPYADSGQIKVLMSGLVGGAAYQQLHQSPSHSSGDWLAYYSAYQAGIAVAIALIVIGLLLQLVLAVLNQAKQRKGG